MVRFVVLTTPRSGSSFFRSSLNHVPQIRCLGDFSRLRFSPVMYSLAQLASNAQIGFYGLPLNQRERLVACYLDAAAAESPGLDAVGFRLMYGRVDQFPEVFRWLEQHPVRVIHLVRKNLLKRMLSWIVKEGGVPAKSSRPGAYQAQIRVRCKGLVHLLTDMENQVEDHRKTFSKAFPYHEVFYEDFVAHRARESNRIGAFLNVGDLGVLSSDLVKVNSDCVSDIVVNYDEVVRTLEGTPYERFLDVSSEFQVG